MGIFVDKKVINLSNVENRDVKDKVYENVRHNDSYCYWYVCGELKPISEVKNQNNIKYYPDHDKKYVYEIGDDIVSDYLMEYDLKIGEEVIFLCSW